MKVNDKKKSELYKKALNYFSQGYNCAQSVAVSLAEIVNMSEHDMLCAMVAFGGGGAARHTGDCGALMSILLVLGFYLNDDSPTAKEKANKIGKQIFEEFERQEGAICCEILSKDKNLNERRKKDARLAQFQNIRPCATIVLDAIDIAIKTIN